MGAERIRGELLKLGIKVSKRTIQKLSEDGPVVRADAGLASLALGKEKDRFSARFGSG